MFNEQVCSFINKEKFLYYSIIFLIDKTDSLKHTSTSNQSHFANFFFKSECPGSPWENELEAPSMPLAPPERKNGTSLRQEMPYNTSHYTIFNKVTVLLVRIWLHLVNRFVFIKEKISKLEILPFSTSKKQWPLLLLDGEGFRHNKN